MKFSSFLVLTGVLIVFAGFQGWYVYRTYWLPREVVSDQATLMQHSLAVGTPVSGIVWDVRARENQEIRKGQYLFVVIPQTPTEPQGGKPVFIPARLSGIVVDIAAIRGDFVQASQELARIVDTDPAERYIEAEFVVPIADWLKIRPGQVAEVRSLQIEEGAPQKAVVSSLNPYYDARNGRGVLRLKFVGVDTKGILPGAGIPVDVSLHVENDNSFRRTVLQVAHLLAPSTLAEKQ